MTDCCLGTEWAGIRKSRTCALHQTLWLCYLALLLVCLISQVQAGGVQTPAAESGYVGKETCGICHTDRFDQHAKSNFAGSWRPASAIPDENFPKVIQEGPTRHTVAKEDGRWVYKVKLTGHPEQVFPIHSVIGGKRFGDSFILQVSELESRKLPRPTLVEARYMASSHSGELRLSPGFPAAIPTNYETALGRVLSPSFAEECLNCHGGMTNWALAQAGGPHPLYHDTAISCERCHGPGQKHIDWLENEEGDDTGIINPRKLEHRQVVELCGQCHKGFFPVLKPRPKDLLISAQATAISNTRCFIESDGGFSCISCHDPHFDAFPGDPAFEKTCLSCHSGHQGNMRTTCPVNAGDGCIDCHMPTGPIRGDFTLTDHWIRVVTKAELPEKAKTPVVRPAPQYMYLRLLVVDSRPEADDVEKRLDAGTPFRELARERSIDPSSVRGGYLGRVNLGQLNADFRAAAATLQPDQRSSFFSSGNDLAMLYRLPAAFQRQARQLEELGDRLKSEGKLQEAISRYEEAVALNPDFIHGYFSLGVAYGVANQPQKEKEAYESAIAIEPDFHHAHYNLGQLMNEQGDFSSAVRSLQQAVRARPDMPEAYINLSAALFRMGDFNGAIRAGRNAVNVNPLLAAAHYNLGIALGNVDPAAALSSFELSSTIDPLRIDAELNAAVALTRMGRRSEAVSRLEKAVSKKPNQTQAKELLSRMRAQPVQAPPAPGPSVQPEPQTADELQQARQALAAGKHREALELYDAALAQNPGSSQLKAERANAGVLLGKAMQGSGRWEAAISLWREVLDAYPEFVPALAALAEARMIQGDFLAAENYLQRGLRREAENPTLIIMKARLAFERRQIEECFSELQKLNIDRLDNPAAFKLVELLILLDLDGEARKLIARLRLENRERFELANTLVTLGSYEEAKALLQPLTSISAQVLRGRVHAAQLQFDQARPAFQAVIQLNPAYWPAWYYLGQTLMDSGEAAEAIQAFLKALELQPRNVNVLYKLGQASIQDGQNEAAVDYLGKAISLEPEAFQLNFEMGKILLEMGRLEESESHLKKVLVTEPDHLRTHYLLGRLYQQKQDIKTAQQYMVRFQELTRRLEASRAKFKEDKKALEGSTLIP